MSEYTLSEQTDGPLYDFETYPTPGVAATLGLEIGSKTYMREPLERFVKRRRLDEPLHIVPGQLFRVVLSWRMARHTNPLRSARK